MKPDAKEFHPSIEGRALLARSPMIDEAAPAPIKFLARSGTGVDSPHGDPRLDNINDSSYASAAAVISRSRGT